LIAIVTKTTEAEMAAESGIATTEIGITEMTGIVAVVIVIEITETETGIGTEIEITMTENIETMTEIGQGEKESEKFCVDFSRGASVKTVLIVSLCTLVPLRTILITSGAKIGAGTVTTVLVVEGGI
jgi:hypothetical protein